MKSCFVFPCVVLLPVAALVAADPGKEDPKLKGKPTSEWLKALKDDDPLIREEALNVLTDSGPETKDIVVAAVRPLLKALDHKDSAVRDEALELLRVLGPEGKSAVPALQAKQKTADLRTRLGIAEVLWYLTLAVGKSEAELLPLIKEGAVADDAPTRCKAFEILSKRTPYTLKMNKAL